jgi:Tol biopolymer transport system component
MLALLVPAVSVSGAADGAPPGPRLTFIRSGEALPGDELLSTDPSGQRWSRLYRTPSATGFFGGLSWSGDGTKLALSTTPRDIIGPPTPHISIIPAAGGRPKAVRGTKLAGAPVFSPDGSTIAFARERFMGRGKDGRHHVATSIWLVDAAGGNSRQLTPWIKDIWLSPSSFAPNGTSLATTRLRPGRSSEVVSLDLNGTRTLLVRNGTDPAYSPDGTTVAFIRERKRGVFERFGPPPVPIWGGDLFLASVDGSRQRRLTFTPAKLEYGPSWDPSGERLAFTQLPAKLTWQAREGIGSAIIEINTDGTCRHRLLFTYGIAYMDAAWQPGPGREVGRIEC